MPPFLRPLYLDCLDVLLPLLVAAAALVAGRHLHRLAPIAFRSLLGLAVLLVLILGASYFLPFPESVQDVLWHLGGETTIARTIASLLLGVVMTARERSTSTAFLWVVVGLVALILVLHSGGRLWWRFMCPATWSNAPNAAGQLTQTTGWTCSPASATMLLHAHGIETTEGEMAYLAGTSYLGTDVRSIAHAMTTKVQARGLVARYAKADYEEAIRQQGPFLACINVPHLGGHAVFVLRAGPDEVEWIDPRFGARQKVPRAEAEPQWAGEIVYLTAAR